MKRLVGSVVLALLLAGGLAGTGQPAAAQTFDQMPGLQQLVVRLWLSPANATPEAGPESGASFVSLGVFQFDTAENAKTAYTSFAKMIGDSAGLDPLMAGAKPEPVAGDADESTALIGNRTEKDIPLSNIYGVARKDTFVYLVQGAMVRVDAKAEVERMLQGAMTTPVGSTPVTFVTDGVSTGGIWDKLGAATPTLVPGSTVVDSVVFPEPTVVPTAAP